uniref:RNA-directed DNA polymerase n=1 Tax=Schizaphis graminum TaxID=13262 RepID=A0A2S2NTU1_SCHGA
MYFTKNIVMSKGDPKQLWNLINEAMYNKANNNKNVNISSVTDSKNKIITDDADIANEFNTFFAIDGENIADKIKTHNPAINYKSKIKVNTNSIFLSNITKDKIKKHILSCKDSTSFYCCNLSNHVLKQIVDYILDPLEYILNLSLSLGIFPNLFKHTLVIPLFKQGDKKNCSNYRPISLIYNVLN